jgi:RNA polymerase sigma factor (sigma-70 family)
MVEDRLLVWRLRHGNKDALCRIYEKYKSDLLALAVSVSNDPCLAEDALHDVFVSFAQAAVKLKLRGSLKGYLSTCIANRVHRLKRLQGPRENGQDQENAVCRDSDRPDEHAISAEQWQRVRGALAQLPYEQRKVVLLRLHSGLSFRTIASAEDISINTIQSRYRYGLQKLQSLLNSKAQK